MENNTEVIFRKIGDAWFDQLGYQYDRDKNGVMHPVMTASPAPKGILTRLLRKIHDFNFILRFRFGFHLIDKNK